jgi:pimeloyl-ACP methyl ester carboxylesterase
LAGHSFGGYISTFYYEKYSERVKQLVLLSPAGSGKLSEEAINARAQRSKFFFWFAEKVFSWGIRPSKVMGTCWIGEKFMDKVLNGRLKLLEDEK